MSTTLAAPRSSRSASPINQPTRVDLSVIRNQGLGNPNRYLLHAVRGWGKTSLSAYSPKAIVIPTEDGIDTLIDAKQLPETPHFPQANTWEELQANVRALLEQEHSYRTAVIDVMDGAESLCHKFICTRDFAGDWGKKGFASYSQGYTAALPEWKMFLNLLDRLRTERKMTVFCLSHTKIRTFKNPLEADYDRYVGNMHETTWTVTGDWADVVLFGNFEVTVDAAAGAAKGKGKGGQERILYTQHHAAYDAKNRLGLDPEIEMGNSPAEAWANFMVAIKKGRGGEAVANG